MESKNRNGTLFDSFAKDFLNYAGGQLGVITDWVRVKVVVSGDDEWPSLEKIYRLTQRGNKQEYRRNPALFAWMRINAFVLQACNVDGKTEEERREARADWGLILPRRLVRRLSKNDAIIFLHLPNTMREERHGYRLCRFSTIAHECTHICERLIGRLLITDFDPDAQPEHPLVTKLFDNFIASVGGEQTFVKRYQTPETPVCSSSRASPLPM